MPLTPGTSEAVQIDPTAHYSTTKPGVVSQTLNPFQGVEAGRTVSGATNIDSKAATEIPATFSTVFGGAGDDVIS